MQEIDNHMRSETLELDVRDVPVEGDGLSRDFAPTIEQHEEHVDALRKFLDQNVD